MFISIPDYLYKAIVKFENRSALWSSSYMLPKMAEMEAQILKTRWKWLMPVTWKL
jgi:hypothetical protein